jgi:hypothetical protein
MSLVKEDEARYFELEDRSYTAAEVRSLLEEVSREVEEKVDLIPYLTANEWEAIDRDDAAYKRGEGENLTWEQLKARLREGDR